MSNLKRVLITGKNSYVGTNVEKWLMREPDKYYVESISVRGEEWKSFDFSKFDVVLHVAGIAHVSAKKNMKDLYFKVNKDLTIKIAEKAKLEGIKQFIFMSTMAVYGEYGNIGKETVITSDTKTNPKTFYALSKLDAEIEILKLMNSSFSILILRPPMIYGPNCPGNYSKFEKLVMKIPFFPYVENKRSVLHIDKLCLYVEEYINSFNSGFFFPQDDDYMNIFVHVKNIANSKQKSIYFSKILGFIIIKIFKNNIVFRKIFGNLIYEK